MFSGIPEEQSESTNTQNNQRRRKKKKKQSKTKLRESFKRKQSKFALSMSTWTDHFISAATWQMKHQIAYWKSKARALEYENKILHEIIRKNVTSTVNKPENVECSVKNEETESDSEFYEDDNFEVSEEFIEFLKTNAKYKEDARREREKLKAKATEVNPVEINVDKVDTLENLKEMYGKDWKRIAALETSMDCDFIVKSDTLKPTFWPNIPFNFNFS